VNQRHSILEMKRPTATGNEGYEKTLACDWKGVSDTWRQYHDCTVVNLEGLGIQEGLFDFVLCT
jgi:hypothetical protein